MIVATLPHTAVVFHIQSFVYDSVAHETVLKTMVLQ